MRQRKKASAQGKRRKQATKSKRPMKAQSLEKAILKIGKQYPELAGQFVLAKLASRKRAGKPFRDGDEGCKRWGKDPVTGELVCIE